MPNESVKLQEINIEGLTLLKEYPTQGDFSKKCSKKANILVYDAEADEYYPVQFLAKASTTDVLDKGHLVLVINWSDEDV